MSLSKYFGEASDSQGTPLWWGAEDEPPFRGMPPTMLKGDEIDEIPVVYDAKVAVFMLPGQEAEYQRVIDRCSNGAWKLRFEKVDYDESSGKYRILISWLEIYKQTPMSRAAWDAANQHNETSQEASRASKYRQQGYPMVLPAVLPKQPDKLMQETIDEIVQQDSDE